MDWIQLTIPETETPLEISKHLYVEIKKHFQKNTFNTGADWKLFDPSETGW